jgi:hypothetical protein
MVWLMNTMEASIKEDELRYFCRTFQIGNTAYVAQRRETITKGLWSFQNMVVEGSVVLCSRGRDGNEWGNCIS